MLSSQQQHQIHNFSQIKIKYDQNQVQINFTDYLSDFNSENAKIKLMKRRRER